MKVICAPDKFKGSMSAVTVAGAMERGVRAALSGGREVEVDLCPVADGGEGTVEALVSATGGRFMRDAVTGPLGGPVEATWGILGDNRTAVIEMAAAAGLALVPPDRRDPTRTTTYGTGELIGRALDHGIEYIILGIGGSATNDGGCGMAQALGVVFRAGDHVLVSPIVGGLLNTITWVDQTGIDPRLDHFQVRVDVACDVSNPLVGPTGASHVYGPQKGATPDQVVELDRALSKLAAIVGLDPQTPGAGAAGGLGYGAMAFLGGTLRRGIEIVLDAVGFEERLRGCDLCLTGEGRLDGQTLEGKTIAGVAAAARRHGVPVVALVGSVGEGWERHREMGVERVVVIGEGLPMEESMRRGEGLMEGAVGRVVRGMY